MYIYIYIYKEREINGLIRGVRDQHRPPRAPSLGAASGHVDGLGPTTWTVWAQPDGTKTAVRAAPPARATTWDRLRPKHLKNHVCTRPQRLVSAIRGPFRAAAWRGWPRK